MFDSTEQRKDRLRSKDDMGPLRVGNRQKIVVFVQSCADQAGLPEHDRVLDSVKLNR